MSREQIVRDTAYAIWEAEGKPQGREREHWSEAEARVDASLAKAAPKAKAAPRAKPAATKAAGATKAKPATKK